MLEVWGVDQTSLLLACKVRALGALGYVCPPLIWADLASELSHPVLPSFSLEGALSKSLPRNPPRPHCWQIHTQIPAAWLVPLPQDPSPHLPPTVPPPAL